jgi:hypothetical protein
MASTKIIVGPKKCCASKKICMHAVSVLPRFSVKFSSSSINNVVYGINVLTMVNMMIFMVVMDIINHEFPFYCARGTLVVVLQV